MFKALLENIFSYNSELWSLNKKTRKSLPKVLVKKLLDSLSFGSGFTTVEYLASAIIDIEIHSAGLSLDPKEIVAKVLKKIDMPEGIVMRHALFNFSHIFSGDGYAAGYYSYLWSEVMDADAFQAFRESGDFFDKKLAKKLERFIYGSGGSVDPKKLYKNFRGRDPIMKPLLRGRGLA